MLSQEGDKWSVKYDVQDLGCHLDGSCTPGVLPLVH